MLQIEEWFRRSQKKPEKKVVSAPRSAAVTHRQEEVHTHKVRPEAGEPAAEPDFYDEPEDMFEPEDMELSKPENKDFLKPEIGDAPEMDEPVVPEDDAAAVSLQDAVTETDELEDISQKIGMDVADMIDMDKEDVLIQQIDEFREKAKQLQELMQNRESKAKELQDVVEERAARANSLDRMVHARQGEADKIMKQVTQRIDAMSMGVRTQMSGLSDTVSKEVGGLSQNLTQNLTQNITHEINQSTEKTRQVVEAATQNMIDQNTRSLEGLKEQLEQLDHSGQIGELSTEMNSQMTTLKADIVEKIHAEDVKCYRNIQVSLDEQSKVLSEGDEKIRGQIQEQMDGLNARMGRHASMIRASLVISVLDLLGIAGIIALLIIR